MNRLERRLWILTLAIFAVSLLGSLAVSMIRGVPLNAYIGTEMETLRRVLRPDREARKLEKVVAVSGVQTLVIDTTATSIVVTRDENAQDLSITLEGRFIKSNANPLTVEKRGDSVRVQVDEGLQRMSWANAFDEGSHNGEISIVLPRQWAGRLDLNTISGDTELANLSLGEIDWKSISGSLDAKGGEMHIAHLESISGDIDYDAETIDCTLVETSGDAMVTLKGLEHVLSPKIDLQTVSGRIDVAVSSQASVRISLSTFTGQSTSTVDLKKSMPGHGALEGRLGSGGGELRLRSVSGSVHLSTF